MMEPHPFGHSAPVRAIRNFSKLTLRATEMSHLGYSASELSSIAMSLIVPRKRNETRLGGYKVRYLDPKSFRLVAFEVFVKAEYFFKAMSDTPLILDCGANIGLATLFFKRLYPKASVRSFEADPATAEVLCQNVKQNNLEDVIVSNILLSDHTGIEKFYVASDTPGSLMMSTMESRFPANAREINVNAGKLSDFINGPVDLLKLDVEGSEFSVMGELVSSGKIKQIRRMIIEYHHRIGNQPSRLSSFLALLEAADFDYDIEAKIDRMAKEGEFHDILISAYRR